MIFGLLVACGSGGNQQVAGTGPAPSQDGGTADGAVEPPPPPPACKAGDEPVLLAAAPGAWAIALDATHVYWAGTKGSGLHRVPKAGGAESQFGAGLAQYAMALDDSHVFVTSETGLVDKVPKGGGDVVALASGEPLPHGIAVDKSYVYFGNTFGSGEIVRMGKDGDKPRVLARQVGQPVALVESADELYWAAGPRGVMSMRKDDTGTRTVMSGEGFVGAIAIAGDWLYVSAQGPLDEGGRILRVPKRNGDKEQLVTGLNEPAGIASDGTTVYFVDRKAKTLHKVPAAGGESTVMANLDGTPWAVAVDGACVYVTLDSPGSVMRFAK